MFRIAIPKGALQEAATNSLAKMGIEFTWAERKLLFETNHPDVQVLIVRPKDVTVYVEQGAAQLGIVGSDVLAEEYCQVKVLSDLGFGMCRLVVAVSQDCPYKQVAAIPDYCKVATKFPTLARQFFRQRGIPVEIIELYGSIEIAPLTGLADAIVDLVGSGRTLQENGLVAIETISQHTAHLICNNVSWQLQHDVILRLLQASGSLQVI